MTRRVLVAGIGNIFLGDDGFGVEVVNRFVSRRQPDGVEVGDFGIRGVHLAYELLNGYDTLVLIDAMPMGEAPGTVAVIRPEPVALPSGGDDLAPVVDSHRMSPAIVLQTLASLGGSVEHVFVVGCQPDTVAEGIGLSSAVAASVEPAVALCDELLSDLVQPVGKEALT